VARISKKLRYNPNFRQALLSMCEKKGCPVKTIPRPVKTRWNSLTHSIGAALDVCPALQVVTAGSIGNKYNTKSCALDESEWAILEQLHTLFNVRSQFTDSQSI
jgi:hypothetical protein